MEANEVMKNDYFILDGNLKIRFIDVSYDFDYSRLKPIELHGRMLNWNGYQYRQYPPRYRYILEGAELVQHDFYKRYSDYVELQFYYDKGGYFKLRIVRDDEAKVINCDEEIIYVHELQHLLRKHGFSYLDDFFRA